MNLFIFDEKLYKNFKIERNFAWLDGFKGLIMRDETLNTTWCAWCRDFFVNSAIKREKYEKSFKIRTFGIISFMIIFVW